jgi:hypothetical protein
VLSLPNSDAVPVSGPADFQDSRPLPRKNSSFLFAVDDAWCLLNHFSIFSYLVLANTALSVLRIAVVWGPRDEGLFPGETIQAPESPSPSSGFRCLPGAMTSQ